MGGFEKKVYAACSRIRQGKVSTYAEIAKAVGSPRAARAVGNALNKNRNKRVPCHRVVCSDGGIGGFAHGSRNKKKVLEREGVKVVRGRIKDFENRFQKLRTGR